MIHPDAVTVAVSSAKGGAGKTTTALAVARRLTRSGVRALVVDLDISDPNLHVGAGVDATTPVCVDDDVSLVLPVDESGVSVLSPLGFERRCDASSLVALSGYADADVIIFDLPPGVESPHSALMLRDVRAWLVVAPPTDTGLIGHVDHISQLNELRVHSQEDRHRRSDRRRKFISAPFEMAQVETCGFYLGYLDDKLVTVRRADAVDSAAEVFESTGLPFLGSVGAHSADDLLDDDGIAAIADWVMGFASDEAENS